MKLKQTKHTRITRVTRACACSGLALACSVLERPALAAEGMQGGVTILSQEAVVTIPIAGVTSVVAWAKSPIRVDGDLSDWRENGIKPQLFSGDAHASWSLGKYSGEEDLNVAMRLCRDDRNLYVAMEIADDRLPAPGRIEFSFVKDDTRLIAGWQDVGMRYGADDAHMVFQLGKNDTLGMMWAHIQQRMDRGVINHSFGTETERREYMERTRGIDDLGAKVYSKFVRSEKDGKTVTHFEAAFPWPMLTPYIPLSYAPLKMNFVVHDKDESNGQVAGIGAVGWLPGLNGVYSGAHFATLLLEPPAGRSATDVYGQILDNHFVNQNISATLAFFNPGDKAQKADVSVFSEPGSAEAPVVSQKVDVPPGYSKKTFTFHSEKVGQTKCRFKARVTFDGGAAQTLTLQAPSQDNRVTIQPVSEIQAKIDVLVSHTQTLSNLFAKIEAKGLDTAYPRAFLTLHDMFVPRCNEDLKRGDSARVLRNCAHLEKMFEEHKAYMEAVLKKPSKQLLLPARVTPDRLQIKNGYWSADGRPVFLWGPCFFWYMRQNVRQVGELGFNSVCPEIPLNKLSNTNQEVVAQMKDWYDMGLLVNASMSVPDLQLTGRDVRVSKILKEHPDLANVDQNNFLPFLVQHPVARAAIADGFQKSIGFWRDFPGVRSYWLWNEPWYLNYSEQTRRDFISQYLKPRYQTIDALNKRWKSQYASFDEIQLTKDPDPANTAPWYDFQQFRDMLLADFFGFLNTTAKSIDPSRPTHTKFMASSLHSFNIEKLQAPYDIAGHDGNNGDRDIIFLDYCRSLYPEKPLVDTEVHIWYGGKTMVDLVAWRLALHGLADGNWWCWTANSGFSDSLGNAESMHALTVSGLDLQRLFHPYMYALNTKPATVATLFPDVVERRGDLKLVRLRHEVAPGQYSLGVRPFYVTESRIAQGELAKHKLLVTADADHVKDSTYQGTVNFVKDGGLVITLRGSFARNEYGDARDTSELIKPAGGEPFCEGARIYPLGKGRVIVIDSLEVLPDVVTDGGQCLAGGPNEENLRRRPVHQRVLAKALADLGLEDPVRITAKKEAAADPQALFGLDWRCAEVDGAYVLCVLTVGKSDFSGVELATKGRIRSITDLIRNEEVSPKKFQLSQGANLFRIELKK